MNPEKLETVLSTKEVVYLETDRQSMERACQLASFFQLLIKFLGSLNALLEENLRQT